MSNLRDFNAKNALTSKVTHKKLTVYDALLFLITIVVCLIIIDLAVQNGLRHPIGLKVPNLTATPWKDTTDMLKVISITCLSFALVIEWHRRRERLVINEELTKKDMQTHAFTLQQKYKEPHTSRLKKLIQKLESQTLQKKDIKTLTHHLNQKVSG